jgi:hypothetical protein
MNVNRYFWSLNKNWPRNPKGYLFLANAVHLAGQRLHGNDWAGTEWDDGGAWFSDMEKVNLLKALKFLIERSLKIETPEIFAIDDQSTLLFHTDEELADIIEKFGLSQTDIKNAVDYRKFVAKNNVKFISIAETISAAISDQDLNFAIRAVKGGSLQISDQNHIWHTENLSPIFNDCQIQHEVGTDEFDGHSLYSKCYIYVDEIQFNSLFPQSSKQLVKPQQLQHLSPYLDVMLKVASSLSITPSNQPKKLVVEAEIRRHWKGSKQLSPNLLSSMATLLRDPESQLWRGRKKD